MTQAELEQIAREVRAKGLHSSWNELIEFSNVGADIDISCIEVPPKLIECGYNIEKYTQMFLTTSYIVTAPSKKTHEIVNTFQEYGMNAHVIGKIINDQKLLRINNGGIKSIDVMRY